MRFETHSYQETQKIGETLGTLLQTGDVVALNGPLGAGKTTFVGGLARGLRIDPRYGVTSPTFVYAHIYPGKTPLYHLDLYRMAPGQEIASLGLDEMVGTDGVTVVEWFDHSPGVWNGDRIDVTLRFGEGNDREIELQGKGSRGQEIEKAMEMQ